MQRGVHIVEKVPRVPNDDPHNLVSWDRPVHNETESHENPGEVWRSEDEETEKAESGIRVSSRPDVDER